MPSPSPKVDINAAVLRWARESANWTVDEIATKLRVSGRQYQEWESTGRAIGVKHLEALAKHYKRSLAVFFLPKPPHEPAPPKDFRVLPGLPGKFERQTRLAIRRATWLQAVASEIFENLGRAKEAQIGTASIEENPEVVGRHQRRFLGTTLQEQLEWPDDRAALRQWRDSIEGKNVLVFSQSMPINDARGFSRRASARCSRWERRQRWR
jgi:transcriptional regulator with XRE-family HTH domain